MTPTKMLTAVAILLIGFTTTVSATGTEEKINSSITPAIVSSTITSISSTTPPTTISTSTKPTTTSISSSTTPTTISTSTKPTTTSISSATPPTTITTSTKPTTTSISSATPPTTITTSTKPTTISISSTTPPTNISTSTKPTTTIISSTTPPTDISTSTKPTTTSISSTTPPTSISTSTKPTTKSISSTTPPTTISTSLKPTTKSTSSTSPVTNSHGSTTTKSSLMSTTTIPTYPPDLVQISETNILFTALEDDLFVELKGDPNGTLQGWRLSVYNASSPQRHDDVCSSISLSGTLDAEGRKIVTKITHTNLNWQAFSAFESVLVVLGYKDKMDFLLYSSKGEIDPGIAENYTTPYNLIFDMKDWKNKNVSLSRCSPANDTTGFVLTRETRNATNYCTLSHSQNLEMKLTLKECKDINLPPDYNLISTNQIITEVNKRKHCGFSRFMVKDFNGSTQCSDDKNQVYFKFQVMYDLPTQWDLIRDGYQSFILDKSSVFKLAGYDWVISNCTEHCLPAVKPPDAGDDDRIRVTVAVVVSCIGVFLIVLIFVIIYMKNKRRGILQFRMTRLDDDEDDLIGDMDDFVGNQGPTFRNFS